MPTAGKPVRRMPHAAGRTSIEKIEMQHFARKLHDLMVQKGFSQSDLAKQIWGTTEDSRGYKVAKGRDRISQYVRGEAIPEPRNLQSIAKVLNVEVSELAPDLVAATLDREAPELAMTAVSGHENKVHLQINTLIPFEIAAQIVGLINKAKSGTNAA